MNETGRGTVAFRVSAGGCVYSDGVYHSGKMITRECVILQLEQS